VFFWSDDDNTIPAPPFRDLKKGADRRQDVFLKNKHGMEKFGE
jgi:hypothetical protein